MMAIMDTSEAQEETVEALPEAAQIKVTISRDRMSAYLTIELPDNAALPTVDEVMEAMTSAGLQCGFIEDAISQALCQPGAMVQCAEGLAPVNGTDACIIRLIDTGECGRPVELEGGLVDYKNLNLYTMVEKGQLLAEKNPATTGTPGKDILGKEISARAGKDVPLLAGKHMEVVDGNKLIATTSGQLLIVCGKMNVTPVQEIKGDVDLSTGNIAFIGDVLIRGSVTEGFQVTASGNIDIYGTVSGSVVEGQNVTVRMGIIGMNHGRVVGKGSVAAKFIENATVLATEDILVSDVVLHSHLHAGKNVIVSGKKGLIVGGLTVAGVDICAKTVGTSSATATELQAGVNLKVHDEYNLLRIEMKSCEDSLNQISQGINKFKAVDPMSLPPERREILLKLTRTQFTLLGQAEKTTKRLAELKSMLTNIQKGQIKVSDTVFPGVRLVIGSLVKSIQEAIRFVAFYAEAGEVKFRPYK